MFYFKTELKIKNPGSAEFFVPPKVCKEICKGPNTRVTLSGLTIKKAEVSYDITPGETLSIFPDVEPFTNSFKHQAPASMHFTFEYVKMVLDVVKSVYGRHANGTGLEFTSFAADGGSMFHIKPTVLDGFDFTILASLMPRSVT